MRTTANIVLKQQQKLPEYSARRRDVAPRRVSSASNSEHIGSKTVCDNLIKSAKISISLERTASDNTVTSGFYSAITACSIVQCISKKCPICSCCFTLQCVRRVITEGSIFRGQKLAAMPAGTYPIMPPTAHSTHPVCRNQLCIAACMTATRIGVLAAIGVCTV